MCVQYSAFSAIFSLCYSNTKILLTDGSLLRIHNTQRTVSGPISVIAMHGITCIMWCGVECELSTTYKQDMVVSNPDALKPRHITKRTQEQLDGDTELCEANQSLFADGHCRQLPANVFGVCAHLCVIIIVDVRWIK